MTTRTRKGPQRPPMSLPPSSLQIYRRESPRAFVVANKEWTLFFQSDKSNRQRSVAEFIPTTEFDLSPYKPLKLQRIYGCLGLISLQDHVFIGVVTGCAQVARIRDGETVQRIHAVEFYCLDSDIFDPKFVDISGNAVEVGNEDLYDSVEKPPDFEPPCAELQRLLSEGSFYFSSDHDLSLSLQARLKEDYDPEVLDRQFLWNDYLISSLSSMRSNMDSTRKIALDQGRFLTSIIRGFAETLNVNIGSGTPGQLTLISRLSSKRAGTRFNARGIDDDGNVANFVETETIVNSKLWTSSFVQIRGSVPLFWEQITSGFMGQHKVEVTRSPSATQAAFEKHFTALLEKYGGAVHIVNLLGSASGEATLTGLYQDAVRSSGFGSTVRSTEFDFHHEVKNGYEGAATIKPLLRNSTVQHGFFLSTNSTIQSTQTGVFRTNCLDCLDRTNMIQNIVSQSDIESVLRTLTIHPSVGLWDRHGTLWADNGDALSRIYAGTGALKTSFTRKGKMSFAGALADATKSAARLYINNFQDKGKQEVIDVMLGRLVHQKGVILFDPIADWVNQEALKREAEWSKNQTLQVFAGTYNLNGREGSDSLDDWLRPTAMADEPDIYAIGFQEIVELTPSQIVSADPVKIKNWADRVLKCLDPKQNDKYVLLRTGQLVGAALLIFVKRKCLTQIKMVEGSTKKTGLKGMSGNKGGVAIRLDYGITRICFVNAHFAAGQSNHVERNQDFQTILGGIKFQRGRNISDHHDAVIWLGDFNYRINLAIEEVRSHIEAASWGTLYSADQLNLQMIKGNVFNYFQEKEITFAPTYKFDNGTDDYDSSEKHRIPAWTDRVMKKGSMIKQILYDSAPSLRFSDHKPVYATYEVVVQIVDDVKKTAIERELYATRKSAIAEMSTIGSDDIQSIIGKDLPAPSSDHSKWWLDNHSQAKSDLKVPPGAALNSRRAPNPWNGEGQPNFIEKTQPATPNKSAMLSTAGFKPPPLPKRTPTANSINGEPPSLPDRSKTVVSRSSSSASVRKENGAAPIPPPTRSRQGLPAAPPDNQRAAERTIKAEVAATSEIDHLNDEDGGESGSLSAYKSLV